MTRCILLVITLLIIAGCQDSARSSRAAPESSAIPSDLPKGATPDPNPKNSALGKVAMGKNFRNSLGMLMIWCPPGSFRMGDGTDHDAERPVHTVEFEQGFWISAYELTQELWSKSKRPHKSKFKGANLPVAGVSWTDAQNFCSTVTALDFKAGIVHRTRKYALPTEAQWEYACRAGTAGPHYLEPVDDIAWHEGNAKGRFHEVGKKKPNAWGIYDMLGNVSEWVEDTFHHGYAGAPTNGSVWRNKATTDKVTRGGHYEANAHFSSAYFRRFFWNPGGGPHFNGFRIVLTPRT